MKNYIFFLGVVLTSLFTLVLVSCSQDDLIVGTDNSVTSTENLTTVTFKMSTNAYGTQTRATESDEHGTDDAFHNEDGIESPDDPVVTYNYAYIFDTDDKYLGNLSQLEVRHSTDDADDADYLCTGQTKLMLPTNFKIVFLGNYDDTSHYGENNDEAEHHILLDKFKEPDVDNVLSDLWTPPTTIDDEGTLCPRFNGEHKPGEYSDYYIPFYGVHLFNDVIIEEDEYDIVLDEPITLIRSIAKVEVNIKGMSDYIWRGYTFDELSATINNAVSIGYASPKGVESQADNYSTTTLNPYTPTQDDNALSSWDAYQSIDDDNAIICEFYLCEQVNSTKDISVDDVPYINLVVTTKYGEGDSQLENTYTYPLYFATYTYDNDGEVSLGEPWDIQRNHLYRFNVNFTAPEPIVETYDIDLEVEEWEEHFDNNASATIR